jgi:hypothetical protein
VIGLQAGNHSLGTSCVNVAEVERRVRPKERKAVTAVEPSPIPRDDAGGGPDALGLAAAEERRAERV